MTSVVPPTAHTNAVKSPVFTCNLCVKITTLDAFFPGTFTDFITFGREKLLKR